MTFRNRILSYGVKPADQFLVHPKNARIHPQYQREVMKSALDTVGFVAPVIEAKSGFLLDGHERVWQGLQNDNAPIPFVVVDVEEGEEAYVLATFDPITSLADYDSELLDGLLREVNSDSEHVQRMLSELAVDVGLYENQPRGKSKWDNQSDLTISEEWLKKWNVVTGQVWQLGSHRLMCGDATSASDMQRLCGEVELGMVFADPPFELVLDTAFDALFERIPKTCHCFVMSSDKNLVLLCAKYAKYFRRFFHVNFKVALIMSSFMPATQVDTIAEFLKGKGKFQNLYDGFTNYMEIVKNLGKDNEAFGHTEHKNPELYRVFIEHYTVEGDSVLDPFAGTGTLLGVCEEMNRAALMMEIDPKAAAIIVEQASRMGLDPVLVQ